MSEQPLVTDMDGADIFAELARLRGIEQRARDVLRDVDAVFRSTETHDVVRFILGLGDQENPT